MDKVKDQDENHRLTFKSHWRKTWTTWSDCPNDIYKTQREAIYRTYEYETGLRVRNLKDLKKAIVVAKLRGLKDNWDDYL
jgi:hypothetical protein